MAEEQYVKSWRWVKWPAEVDQNFDANGAPCEEPPVFTAPEALKEVVLVPPLEFIRVEFIIGGEGGRAE